MAGTKKQKVTDEKRDESRKHRHKQRQKQPKKYLEVPQSKSKTSYSQLSKSQRSKLAADPRLKQLRADYYVPQKLKTSGGKKKAEKYQQQKQAESHKKKKKEKCHEKDTSANSQASSQTKQEKPSKKKTKRESKNSKKEESVRDKQPRREKCDKNTEKEKIKKERNEKSKPRKSDHFDLTMPTDSSLKVMRRSQLLEPKLSVMTRPPITPVPVDWSTRSGVAAQPMSLNVNEVLRIGGVLGRYGMNRKRRDAFDWLASHPLEAAEGSIEAVYNVRVAVGDLSMSRLLVTQVLRLLVDKGEVTTEEYQRHFSMLEQNLADQAITISQFAYFINMHCEKYKYLPIVTYNNSNNTTSNK